MDKAEKITKEELADLIGILPENIEAMTGDDKPLKKDGSNKYGLGESVQAVIATIISAKQV